MRGKRRATLQLVVAIKPLKLAFALSLTTQIAGAQHDMSRMAPSDALTALSAAKNRAASGTSWLPDSAPMAMLERQVGPWSLTAHGRGFGMLDRQWTLHGDSRWDVVDQEMLSASRGVGDGSLRLSAMTSLESFFLPDTGYAQLLQSGETFHGRRIANTQHPHDLVGELSASYDHSLTDGLATSIYLAAVGEPALGPVAYQHRPSAMADPFAPLGHHWQDAAHNSHGVVTAGVYTRAFKLEGSAFNAREPDDNRRNIDYNGARLDSYAGRITFVPSPAVAFSTWAGYLADHDPLDPGVVMQRYGASMLTESRGLGGGHLSTAVIWGLNNHHHGARAHDHDSLIPMTHHLSSSVLFEATLGIGLRTQVFGRAEQVQKMADDLGFLGGNLMETFNVRALSVGAARQVASTSGVAIGVGGRIAVNVLPQTLRYTYTTTKPAGFAVYVTAALGRR